MSSLKSFINTFLLIVAVFAMTACVPKATEKKANCGVDQAFNSVSRSCHSIQELRTRPIGTTSTVSLFEETPKKIILAYTDSNKDLALSCKINPLASELEIIPSSALSGGLNDKAQEVNQLVKSLAAELAVSSIAMEVAFLKAKTSLYFPTKTIEFEKFRALANSLLDLGVGSANSIVKTYYNSGKSRMLELDQKLEDLANRCECSGGICSTTLIPKLNKTGVSGFSYTITDVDGEGAVKPVAVTINAIPELASSLIPVGQSSLFTGNESDTSIPTHYTVIIAEPGDVLGTSTSSFLYKFKVGAGFTRKNGSPPGVVKVPAIKVYAETSKGFIFGCMDLNPNLEATNDRECTYVPKDGDAYDPLPAYENASTMMGSDSAVFTAKAPGTAGNKLTVQYLNIQTSYPSSQVYGLTNSTEAFIRVVGNAIKIYINPGVTSSLEIQALVASHPQANKMVSVSPGAGDPMPSGVVPLLDGLDAFDKIPFIVNNTKSDSINDAEVTISIISVNDRPMVPKNYIPMEFSQPLVFREDDLKAVKLKFRDVDDNDLTKFSVTTVVDILPNCIMGSENTTLLPIVTSNFVIAPSAIAFNVDNASPNSFNANLDITPELDFNGPACLYYKVSDSNLDSFVQSVQVMVTPVNDAPVIKVAAINSLVIPDPVVDLDLVTSPQQFTILEGGSGYIIVDIGPGGGSDELNQVLTLTTSSANLPAPNTKPLIFPPGSIVISKLSPDVPGKRKITFTPKSFLSGSSEITLTLKDDGGTADGGVDVGTMIFELVVTPVNNPPVFLSNITKIETNEGGAVQSDAFVIDEDFGSTDDENHQIIKIESVESDNPNVLPNTAIRMFYDLNDNGVEDIGEARCAIPVVDCPNILEDEDGADVSLRNLYFKLDPVDGISGNANITLKISDQVLPTDPLLIKYGASYLPLSNPVPGAPAISTSFSLIVHPIAALHGGWKNISSVGIKADKLETPVNPEDIACNYSIKTTDPDSKSCSGKDCTGLISPNGEFTPDEINVIYYDSVAKRCYRADGLDKFSWVDFNTSCPVTRSKILSPQDFTNLPDEEDFCSGDNCINDSNLVNYPKNVVTPVAKGHYLYNLYDKTCHLSVGTKNTDWVKYVPSKVTLEWKPFIIVGSGSGSGAFISGWNIYRREPGQDYNFKGGHLRSATSTNSDNTYSINKPNVLTFTDTTAIAGKIYFYVVRPVSSSTYNGQNRTYPTYTPEIFSEVRVIASPANYSFVHRWIVNQEICNGMNITTTTNLSKIDPTKNFRCQYSGPGESPAGYYDYGRDLLVDSQELGCAYAPAPKCSANGCIGIGAPISTKDVVEGDLYYDRGNGACYHFNGLSFQTVESSILNVAALVQMNSALNPPLVNLTQARSELICSERPKPEITNVSFDVLDTVKLPNRKDYNAYASQRVDKTDSEITEIELGYSLNIHSRCNSSSASGLEIAYTDASIPSTSLIFALPGSFTSGVRSIYTGSVPWSISKGTEDCRSRFGIQDLYGNVAEWTSDKMDCSGANHVCTSSGMSASYSSYDFGGYNYGFNNVVGPFNDSEIVSSDPLDLTDYSGPSANDLDLTAWIYEFQLFKATKFSYPIGLPISSNITSDPSTLNSPALKYLLNINSSGIQASQLHGDGMIPNVAEVRNNATNFGQIGAFAVGGSYLSGNMAGRFTSELVPATSARPDIGQRCIVPIKKDNYNYTDTQHTYDYSFP